jgi:hypothetical protein
VLRMIQEGKISGRAVLLAGQPGTGKVRGMPLSPVPKRDAVSLSLSFPICFLSICACLPLSPSLPLSLSPPSPLLRFSPFPVTLTPTRKASEAAVTSCARA